MTVLDWVLAYLTFDLLLRIVVRGMPTVKREKRGVTSNGVGIFVEPGILANAKNQISPIADLLRAHGTLFYCTLGRVVYSPSWVRRRHARKIVRMIYKHNLNRVVFCAVSLGATTSLDVMEELARIAPELPKPELIVFDGVGSGSKNLLSGGNVAGPVCSWLRFFPIGLITRVVLESIIEVPKSCLNKGPVADEIEDDIVIDGESYTKEAIQKKAKKDMSWYLLGVFLRQVAHMHESHLTEKRMSNVWSVAYFEYTWHNVTVKQPDERNAWQAAAEAAHVPFKYWSVEAPHAALAQMPEHSRAVVGPALQEIL